MNARKTPVRQNPPEQMARLDPQKMRVLHVCAVEFFPHFAQTAQHHIRGEDDPFRMAFRQRDRKSAFAAAEIQFHILPFRERQKIGEKQIPVV